MEFIADWVGSICSLCFGAIFIGLGIPLAARKVPRNRVYGFRTKATLADDDTWFRVNELAGRQMTALGVVFVLSAAASFVLFQDRALQMVMIAASTVLLAAGMIATMIAGKRLTDKKPGGGDGSH